MDGNLRPIATVDFKQMIAEIIHIRYQHFFAVFEAMIAEIEQKFDSPGVEIILTQAETIQSETKQIFYKEKLILFPFLEKSYTEDDQVELPLSVSQIKNQTAAAYTKINQLIKDSKNLDEKKYAVMEKHLNELCGVWKAISNKKDELYEWFLLKKNTGR